MQMNTLFFKIFMSVVVNEQTVFTNIATHARTDENSKLNLKERLS